MDKPEYGKQYALTGKKGEACIMNGNTWAESEIKDWKEVPVAVKQSQFGCCNCLWNGCECKGGSKYRPETYEGKATCGGYTYYD